MTIIQQGKLPIRHLASGCQAANDSNSLNIIGSIHNSNTTYLIRDFNMPKILKITATVVFKQGEASCYETRFRTVDGKWKTLLIPREKFETPRQVVALLLDSNMNFAESKATSAEVVDDALKHRKGEIIYMTRVTGWRNGSFVTPRQTFDPRKKKSNLSFDPRRADRSTVGLTSGSAKKWRKLMFDAFAASDYLLFAAALGGAASLLNVIGERESVAFHLHGNADPSDKSTRIRGSSSGKTLMGRVGYSMTGRCKASGDIVTLAMTERAAEETFVAHNHLLVFLDEAARVSSSNSPNRLSKNTLAYAISGGIGVQRSKIVATAGLPNLSWTTLAMTTGEHPLDNIGANQRPEGARTRMIGIPVPPGDVGGIFNRLNRDIKGNRLRRKSARLADDVEAAIRDNYGILVSSGFYQKLVDARASGTLKSRCEELSNNFLRHVGTKNLAPWERRFASKFALVYTSAVLMREYRTVSWSDDRALSAIAYLYNKARASCSFPEAEASRLLSRLRAGLADKTYRNREQLKDPGSRAAKDFKPFKQKIGEQKVICITKERLSSMLSAPALYTSVMAELHKRGCVMPASDKKLTRQIMIDNERRRFVCLLQDRIR